MQPTTTIRHLKQEAIDRVRWDACIDAAPNGSIYSYSFYLDRMATHWDALVLGDYEAVMPLPWRKKWNIAYIYQPFLEAQLGVFGSDLTTALVDRFLGALPRAFRLVEYPLNQGNHPSPAGAGVYRRANYVLDLSLPYARLQHRYREQTRRNIRKAEKYGCTARQELDVEQVLRLSDTYTAPIADADRRHFKALYQFLHDRGQATTYSMVSNRGELLASCVFFFSHARAYYILVGNHPNGRTLGASHALVDAFIRDHAGRPLTLDFEGSDLRNLAFFYSSFGAHEEPYPALRLNRLPWWMKWMKK